MRLTALLFDPPRRAPHLRQMLQEFNSEQFVRLVDMLRIKLNAIFESELLTNCNKSKGYLASFPHFVKSLMMGSKHPLAGPVDVDLSKPAVSQLWNEVSGVINTVNKVCRPLLEKFGIVEGNGLSPFAVDMHKPEDLLAQFTLFSQSPPKHDPCDKGPNADGQVDVDDGDKEVTEDSEDESDAAEGG
jgi:hypothetical protein